MAQEQLTASRGSSTVTVGCKLPHGLLMQSYLPRERAAPGMPEIPAVPRGEPVLLAGSTASSILGGFGITEGVDAEFFEAWLKENQDYAPVKSGLIFAIAKASDVKAEAKSREKVRSGLEALDPNKPAKGVERVKD